MARAVVEVGEGGYARCARQGRAPLLPIESGNEEMMLPLTLEIQMRAMARTLQGQVHVAEDLPCSETRRSQGSSATGRNASGT